MARVVSLIALLAIIVFTGLLFYKVMIGFFVPLFLAAVLVVVFRPLHQWVLAKTGDRERIAAVFTTVLILLSVLLPVSLIVTSAALQASGLMSQEASTSIDLDITLQKFRNSLGLQLDYADQLRECQKHVDEILTRAKDIATTNTSGSDSELSKSGRQLLVALDALEEIVRLKRGPVFSAQFTMLRDRARAVSQPFEEDLGYKQAASDVGDVWSALRESVLGGPFLAPVKLLANPDKEQFNALKSQAFGFIRPQLLSVTGATSSFLIHLAIGSVVLIISIYFFLHDGPGMVKAMMALSPLDDRYEKELLTEFDRISRAMVLATLLAAITQGTVAGLGYYVAGVPSLLLLIILTTIFAMIPFVGPMIVWIPVCLYLAFYEERIGAAIGLAAWGMLVVGTIDNFVKAYVLHGQSQLHPLFALLSVLGGVQALGPIGIVVGPMVVALLQTLLSILQREMVHFEDHSLVVANPAPAATPRQTRFRLKKKRPKPDQPVKQASDAPQTSAPANSVDSKTEIQSESIPGDAGLMKNEP